MTRLEQQIAALLSERIGEGTAAQTVERLIGAGLIDLCKGEQLAIREAVREECRQGTGRCEAFERVADRFHCSYGKVRKCYYQPS